MGRLSLNCDLGENESLKQTEALMQWVDAVNICCGVHAGSAAKTRDTLQLAKQLGVRVGAHPGLASAGGRGAQLPSAKAFEELLDQQLGSFHRAATELGVGVNHVKLHGSLYMAVERDQELAMVYLEQLNAYPELQIYALSGGAFARLATAHGREVYAELFADRGYQPDGKLVARDQPEALIESVDDAVARMRHWLDTGMLSTVTGDLIALEGDTLCVHSDSPNALQLLRALDAL